MPSREQLATALRNADAAGDVEAATKLATALKGMPAEPQTNSMSPFKSDFEPKRSGSIFDSLGQGTAFGFSDEIAGLAGALPASISQGISPAAAYRGVRDQARGNEAQYAEENPKTALAANIGGGLLTGGAGAARTLAGTSGKEFVKRSGMLGAGTGGVAGLGGSEAESAQGLAVDTAVGAGVGAVAGAAFPALGQGLSKLKQNLLPPSATSPEYAAQVARLADEGVDMTSGQQLGSNWQKGLETQLAQTPIGGKPLQEMFEGQQKQYQSALLRQAGLEDGGNGLITRETLDQTKQALSAKYKEALGGKTVSVGDDAFLDNLAEIEVKHTSLLPFEQKKQVNQIIGDLLETSAEKGKLSGEEYQRIRSNLGEKERSTKNSVFSALYGDLKRSLDDAFERTAGSAKKDVDSQYARYSQLKKLYERNGGPAASEGFISPVQVAREASGSPGGTGWQDFTRAGASVLPDRIPNSGTAQRMTMAGLLGGAGMVSPTAAGGALLTNRILANQLSKRKLDVSELILTPGLLQSPLAAAPGGAAGLLTRDRAKTNR